MGHTCVKPKRDLAEEAVALIAIEYRRATNLNGAFNSAHEGYAVILEELDELKEEVWKKASRRDREAMVKEAVQVGAMALRFLVDVALPEPPTHENSVPVTDQKDTGDDENKGDKPQGATNTLV